MQIIKKGSSQKWIGNVYSVGTDAAWVYIRDAYDLTAKLCPCTNTFALTDFLVSQTAGGEKRLYVYRICVVVYILLPIHVDCTRIYICYICTNRSINRASSMLTNLQ
jgi:hypothetical protein